MGKITAIKPIHFWVLFGLLALFLIWFLPWRFQTNDDELMMWLVSGAYTGTPESYAVFIHPLLSWIFAKFYSLFPEIRWYPLAWFGLLFLSFVGLLKVVFKNKGFTATAHVIAAVFFCLVVHFAFFMQFTIVAGFATLSGFSLLFLRDGEAPSISGVLPWLLLGMAILIRWESFVLVGLGIAGYFLFAHFPVFKIKSFLLFVLGLLFVIGFLSKVIWENNSPYADFVKYNQARAAVSDHPVSYRLQADLDIDPNSKWFYFSQWMMDDDGLTLVDLKERKAILDNELGSLKQIQSSFSRLVSILKVEAFKSVFSLILLLGFFFSKSDWKKKLLFLMSWALFFLIFNHFFILNGRVLILFIFPFAISFISSPVYMNPKLTLPLVFGLILLLGIHLYNTFQESRGRAVMRDEFLKLLQTIPDSSLIVLEGYKENSLGINYSSSNPVPMISLGWISKSPFQEKALARIGLKSIKHAREFYLFGVDVHKEFFFIDYMNFESSRFELVEKTERDNWFLFHFRVVNR